MKKTTLVLVTLLVVSGLMLLACTSMGSSAGLTGVTWKLVSYGPAANQTPAVPGIQTSLTFGTDGTVNGSLGCNSLGGKYEVQGDSLVFSQMVSTMMACPGPQMTQES